MWPTRKQWNSWSLPSRLTAVSTLVGILSLIIMLALEISKSSSVFQSEEITISDHGVDKSNISELISILEFRAMMVNKELEKLSNDLSKPPHLIKHTNDIKEQFNDFYERLISALSEGKTMVAHEMLGEIHRMGARLTMEEEKYKEAATRMSNLMATNGVYGHTISAWSKTINGFMNGIKFNAANKAN